MALLSKIDSNVTGLAIAREVSNGVLPDTPLWIAMQPNEYPGNFGGELSLTARNPISQLRQQRKGVVTDLNAAGAFAQDMTMYTFQPLWPGLFLAERLSKPQRGGRLSSDKVMSVAATTGINLGVPAADLFFTVGMLVHTEGFTNAANNTNDVARAITSVTGNNIVISGLVNEAAPPDDAIVRAVGFQFPVGDVDVVRSAGDFPQLTSAQGGLVGLRLIKGETIFIGGAAPNNNFDDPGNTFVRARIGVDPTSNTLQFDQTSGGVDQETEMTAEDGAGKTIQIYFADVINNVSANSPRFSQETYTLQRSLGQADDAIDIFQGETVNGALWNTAAISVPTGDKVTISAEFLATNNQNFTGAPNDLLPGQPADINELPESAAFNTTNDIPDIRLYQRSTDPAAIVPRRFFRFISELTVNVSNNATANKAVGVLGAFAVTAGNFTSTSEMTGYFQNVGALEAIRNNADVGLYAFADQQLNGRRAGLLFDLPFGSVSTPGLNVTADAPITAPLTMTSAVDPVFEHTMIIHEFWFLPSN